MFATKMMQVGSRSEASGIAKAGAKMVMAVSCAKVGLKFFLVPYVQFRGFVDKLSWHNR